MPARRHRWRPLKRAGKPKSSAEHRRCRPIMSRRGVRKALSKTQKRKKEHLELCLNTESVTGPSSTGLDGYRFTHNALPELDIDEIDLGTFFLGKKLQAPLLISSMTGGFELARKVNRNLAAAAQELGLAMGVGSQRVAIEET